MPTGSQTSLDNPALANPSFTLDQPGAYRIRLVVKDGKASSTEDLVIVSTLNSKPLAKAIGIYTTFPKNWWAVAFKLSNSS